MLSSRALSAVILLLAFGALLGDIIVPLYHHHSTCRRSP